MDWTTIAALVALAVVDSINPSAIVVTLYLLTRDDAAAQVVVYIAAIFLAYFTLGLLLMLGLDAFLPSASNLSSALGFIVQGLIGLALLAYALTASRGETAGESAPPPAARTYAALALLGVGVTVMEFPTALPYLAAIGLLTGADVPTQQWVPLLAAYNAIFVMPPVLLLLGHVAAGARLRNRYATLRLRVQREARETALWIAGLVGGGLLITSVIELVARAR